MLDSRIIRCRIIRKTTNLTERTATRPKATHRSPRQTTHLRAERRIRRLSRIDFLRQVQTTTHLISTKIKIIHLFKVKVCRVTKGCKEDKVASGRLKTKANRARSRDKIKTIKTRTPTVSNSSNNTK